MERHKYAVRNAYPGAFPLVADCGRWDIRDAGAVIGSGHTEADAWGHAYALLLGA